MAAGCSIDASDTAPFRELISNRKEGLLVNFFDVGEISEGIQMLLSEKTTAKSLSDMATVRAQDYDFKRGCKKWLSLIEGVS